MARLRRSRLAFLACLGATCLAVSGAFASPLPGTLPVQGVLRTTAGGPVADGGYTLTVRLYDQVDAASPIWKQVVSSVAVSGGLFTFDIGADPLLPLPPALTASGASLWFGIQVGNDNELPRTAIGWIPRAFWANVAASAQALSCSGCISAEQIAGGTITADKIAFNFAASASAGGPATSALTASKADSATTAASALTAGSADTAASAATAGSADVAKDLSCTSCVALAELATDAKAAFLSITGGTLTGALTAPTATVTGTLTVGKILDLTGAIVLGGSFGPGGACDAAHNGAFTWDTSAHRFSLCDGASYRKLAFCSEQCQDASKIACGAAIPDICGDTTSGCAGKGTLCATAGQQCLSNTCQAIPASCAGVLAANSSAATGMYSIDPDGPGGNPAFSAYCDMDNDGKGWTLVMKINGGNSTFNYESPYWSNIATLNPASGAFDQNAEHKSAAYGTLPFSAVRVTFYTGSYATVAFPQGGSSLLALFGSDTYTATNFGRSAWQGMTVNGSLLANCNREGFNVRPYSNPGSPGAVYTDAFNIGVLHAKFGILTNNEADCKTPDAVIGFGISGVACSSNTTTAAGNFAFCGASPFDQTKTAWAYVFVR